MRAEYLAAWRTICLPQNYRPSYPSVLQVGVGQPVKVVQGVQHSSLPQEEPPSSRHSKRSLRLSFRTLPISHLQQGDMMMFSVEMLDRKD